MATAAERQVIGILQATPWLMQALRTAASMDWASWCIDAGAVRAAVWDALHGREAGLAPPDAVGDIDVVYFAPEQLHDASWQEAEQAAQQRLHEILPGWRWEVVNQAAVHVWYRDDAGQPVLPFGGLGEALASWPETATCVGAWLDAPGAVQLLAPLGVDDLLALRVRHNPRRVSVAVYRERMARKQWAERWPKLLLDMPPAPASAFSTCAGA